MPGSSWCAAKNTGSLKRPSAASIAAAVWPRGRECPNRNGLAFPRGGRDMIPDGLEVSNEVGADRDAVQLRADRDQWAASLHPPVGGSPPNNCSRTFFSRTETWANRARRVSSSLCCSTIIRNAVFKSARSALLSSSAIFGLLHRLECRNCLSQRSHFAATLRDISGGASYCFVVQRCGTLNCL